MGIIGRVREFFSSEPPLASALLRAAPADLVKTQELEKRFSLAYGSWRMSPRGDNELLKAYGENPYLFGPVATISEAVAMWEPRLYRTKKGQRARDVRIPHHMERADGLLAMKTAGLLDEVAQDPLLDLLSQPMPGITGFEFWELAATFLTLLGEDLFVKEGRPSPGRGAPRWLNIISPTQIQRRPSPEAASFEIRTNRVIDTVGILDTIWTRRINPADIYTGVGVGPGRALKDEIATDEAAAATARARFKNRAMPDLLVGLMNGTGPMAQPAGEGPVKQFAKDFADKHQGTERAGGAHFFGGDFKAQQLGHTLVESGYIDVRKFGRDTAMQTLRMPPEKLGVLENANRSTIDAAETLFQKGAVLPILNRLCAALQSQLVPDFGGDLVLGFTNPVPADYDFKKAVMVALSNAFTRNEVRKLAGEEPLKGPDGDALYTLTKLTETAALTGAQVPVPGTPKTVDSTDPATAGDVNDLPLE